MSSMGESRLMKVEGLRHLDDALNELSLKMKKSYVTSGLMAAAKPVISKAKEGASRSKHPSSGALSDSIGVKAQRKGGESISVWVGSMREDSKALQSYFSFYYAGKTIPLSRLAGGVRHGHLIELGTANGVEKREFLRPALDSQAGKAVSEFKRVVKRKIGSMAARKYRAQRGNS